MDIGILPEFRNPAQWATPIEQIYREGIEKAVLAERLGFDHFWTSEHHFAVDSWSPSLLTILAAAAARTSRIRLGTFIIILPFHQPWRIAEDATAFDLNSGGRLDLGVGPGWDLNEFESLGVPIISTSADQNPNEPLHLPQLARRVNSRVDEGLQSR